MKRIQPHIMCGIGDVARYVLIPGDPDRVKRIASFWNEARHITSYRGFTTYTGKIKDIMVSSCSGGIGCPSLAIAMEELINLGSDTFIRVGTCGALVPELDSGDIIIVTGAVRWEGTSKTYVPIEYPAIANIDVVNALLEAAKDLDVKVHSGIVISSDSFYGGNNKVLKLFGEANVLAIEMESSLMFTLASVKRKRAGSICVVDGNIFKGTGKSEFEPDEKTGELTDIVQQRIDDEIKIAVQAIQILDKNYSRS